MQRDSIGVKLRNQEIQEEPSSDARAFGLPMCDLPARAACPRVRSAHVHTAALACPSGMRNAHALAACPQHSWAQ